MANWRPLHQQRPVKCETQTWFWSSASTCRHHVSNGTEMLLHPLHRKMTQNGFFTGRPMSFFDITSETMLVEVFCSHTEKGLWVRKQLSGFQVIRFRLFGFSGSLNIDSADRQPSTQNVALASSSCTNITTNDFLSSKQRAIGQEMSDCLQMLFGAKWKGVKAEVMLDEETAALQHTLRH